MTTVREWLIAELEARGLWAHEARKVFYEYVENGTLGMAGRWDEDIASHTLMQRSALKIAAFHDAAEWIKNNEPQHWAKEYFV